jgi:branched-chain amino acid aminotransferase
MHRIFSRLYFKASQLQIIKSAAPKIRLPDEKLVFGRSFTDHMLTVKWSSASGWARPTIKPLENLSLSPASSVLHYATEVRGFNGKSFIF